jgi:uncharacterized protein
MHASGIDAYMRIPTGRFAQLPPFAEDRTLVSRLRSRGLDPPDSLLTGSMPTLLAEMHAADLGMGLVPARGGVTNVELLAALDGWEHAFSGVGQVHPGPRLDDELTFCLRHMVGCFLEPGLHQPPQQVDATNLWDLYGSVSDAGLPLLLMTGGDSGPDLSYVSMERLDRVAAAFPQLVIVVVHGGWPRVTDAIAVAGRRANVYLSPDLFWCNVPGSRDYVMAANGYLREKIVFGTGYPRSNHGGVVEGLRRTGLADAAWSAISFDNPLRAFPRLLRHRRASAC